MIVKSVLKDYEVIIEKDSLFFNSLVKREYAFFVISKTVYFLYNEYFKEIDADRLYIISSTEENKRIETALDICAKITQISAKRNTTLITVGGGIIQDITGFVASIMYRGIHWVFVPTTLLSACDSCIGGKTSLNFHNYKNLIGTFYPPDEIHIWSKLFQSLKNKDFYSGLGEVVKFNIMSGYSNFKEIERDIDSLIGRNPDCIDIYVNKSLLYKRTFIEVDEFDRGERIKLNFAHTFGHSIEVISEFKIPHGTAVAIGMIMANYISNYRGYISSEIKNNIEDLLMRIIKIDINLLKKPLDSYISIIKKDKKQINDNITAVLITRFDKESELTVVHDVRSEEIEESINYFINKYEEMINDKSI